MNLSKILESIEIFEKMCKIWNFWEILQIFHNFSWNFFNITKIFTIF